MLLFCRTGTIHATISTGLHKTRNQFIDFKMLLKCGVTLLLCCVKQHFCLGDAEIGGFALFPKLQHISCEVNHTTVMLVGDHLFQIGGG